MFQRLLLTSMLAALPAFVQQTPPPASETRSGDWITAEQIRQYLTDQIKQHDRKNVFRPIPATVTPKQASPNRSVAARQAHSGRCSVPLVNVAPPSDKGTIIIIEPRDTQAKMPSVALPAPPCETR